MKTRRGPFSSKYLSFSNSQKGNHFTDRFDFIIDWKGETSEDFVVGTCVSETCQQQTFFSSYERLKLAQNKSYLQFSTGMAWGGAIIQVGLK